MPNLSHIKNNWNSSISQMSHEFLVNEKFLWHILVPHSQIFNVKHKSFNVVFLISFHSMRNFCHINTNFLHMNGGKLFLFFKIKSYKNIVESFFRNWRRIFRIHKKILSNENQIEVKVFLFQLDMSWKINLTCVCEQKILVKYFQFQKFCYFWLKIFMKFYVMKTYSH
jgi:hypothetical protein